MRPIPHFPNYFATQDGRIYSTMRVVPKFLKPKLNRGGYEVVVLMRNGVRHNRCVHQLILDTYKGFRPEGMEACHNDGNQRNNYVTNLRWDTHESNVLDRILHGSHVGEKNGRATITEEAVRLIREDYHSRMYTHAQISSKYGMTYEQVWRIATKRRWAHVT